MLPHVYRVTKYDPADRNEHGHYIGAEDTVSDHGPVEAAYLKAAAAFAEDSGIDSLEIRDPEGAGFVNFGLETPVESHGLAGLFSPDLTGYHDGARVPLNIGLGLLQAMLRDSGAWCRLEVEETFFVHVGYDQYMYIGSTEPCERAVTLTRSLGLFPERIDVSPYDPSFDEPAEQRPADDRFWAELTQLTTRSGTVILEEGYLANASRWHRLHAANISEIRARLTPRARLLVWPELSTDVAAVLRALPLEGGLINIVWEHQDGQITALIADEDSYPDAPARLAEARAAMVIPLAEGEYHPLLTAVLPDNDGVLRARWAA